MFSAVVSRLIILLFGTLYPAYASYKAVKTKNVKEYVKWMMYWIVFALFTCAETFTDVFFCWFPFYYELKIIIVLWLLSPATKGSSILYRKFVHPLLSRREQEIDEYITKAKEQGYHTVLHLGTKGVNYATTVIMQTAIKGGGGLVNQLKKSYSLSDLTENEVNRNGNAENSHTEADETDDIVTDPRMLRSVKARAYSPKRSSSGPNRVEMYFPEVDVDLRQTPPREPHVSHIRSSDDVSSSGYSSAEYVGQMAKIESTIREGSLVRTASVGGSTRSRTKTVKSSTVITKKTLPTEDFNQDDLVSIPSSTLFYLLQQADISPLLKAAKIEIQEECISENNLPEESIIKNDLPQEENVTKNSIPKVENVTNDNLSQNNIPENNLSLEENVKNSLPNLNNTLVKDDDSSSSQEFDDAIEFVTTKFVEISPEKSNNEESTMKKEEIPSIKQTNNPEKVSDKNADIKEALKSSSDRAGRYNKRIAPALPKANSFNESEKTDVKAIKATLTFKQGLLKTIDSALSGSKKDIFLSKSSKQEKQSSTSRHKDNFSTRFLKIQLPFWNKSQTRELNLITQTSSLVNIDQLKVEHPVVNITKRSSWHEFDARTKFLSPRTNANLREARSNQELRSLESHENKTTEPEPSNTKLFIRNMSESPSQRRKNIQREDQITNFATLPRSRKTSKKKIQ